MSKMLPLLLLIILLLSCGNRSDGFGSETTNGTVAIDIVVPDTTIDSLSLEVTLIPTTFNPIVDSDTLVIRDTITLEEASTLASVIEGAYTMVVRSLGEEFSLQLYKPELIVEAGKKVSIVDTLQKSGNLTIVYTHLEQIEPYDLYIPGTDITKDGGTATVIDDSTVTVTIDSLPVGTFPPCYLWDSDYKIGSPTTDSIEIHPDSTVVVNALL